MRIAKDDSCPHFEKTVDKEEARFEKFFVNQNSALTLRSSDKSDGSHVGRETGPRSVRDVRDSTPELFFNFEGLILCYVNIFPLNFSSNS